MLDQSALIRIIAFILMGASGTFLLLPHQHGLIKPVTTHRVGYVLVGLAVLDFASFWTAHSDLITRFFFYGFGLAAVLGAILTVTNRNPIYSALWFASVVLATAGLFLLSGAQFLAAGTVIVYAGAIIVTFLFVIMLAQMEGRAIYDRTARSPFWATFSSFLLLFGLCYSLLTLQQPPRPPAPVAKPQLSVVSPSPLISAAQRMVDPTALSTNQRAVMRRSLPLSTALPESVPDPKSSRPHVASLGTALYTEHLVTVELAGALLFVALIGALSIAAPKTPVRPATTDAAANAGV